MSFFNSKNKFSYKLSIALKSSSIDFQLIKSDSSNKKEILFIEKKVLLLQSSQDPLLYTSQYTKELSLLFDKNHIKIKQLINNEQFSVHFVLYSPWFTSSIDTVSESGPSILDEKFVSRKMEEFKINKNLKIIEQQVIKIQANGYTLEYLPGVKSNNIKLQIYSSYISEQIQELLINVIKKYFTLDTDISYTTTPLLISNSIKRFMVKEDNVIFLHVGGEITEVGIIKDDSLDHFTTFPIGIHDFLRGFQSKIKTYDYDLLYQKEIQIKSEKTKKQFENIKKTWGEGVINAFNSFKNTPPNKILIITDQKTNLFFTKILLESIKTKNQDTLQNQRIITFDISLLKDIITHKTPLGENELELKLEALI